MSETQETYQINKPVAVTKNYSLTMLHIGKVAKMAQRLSVSQGGVVRQAIDLLWDKLEGQNDYEEAN